MNKEFSNIRAKLKKIVTDFLSVFFPFKCHLCSQYTEWGVVMCDSCRATFASKLINPQQVTDVKTSMPIYCISSYDKEIAEAIRIVKYRPSSKLLHTIVEVIKKKQLKLPPGVEFDVFIPVPLHWKRKRERGFNQTEPLTLAFADIWGANSTNIIERVKNTKAQASCDAKERGTNLDGAFVLNNDTIRKAFYGKRLCLVDDVATTGTTLDLCSKVLSELKPASISSLVLSHSYKKSLLSQK